MPTQAPQRSPKEGAAAGGVGLPAGTKHVRDEPQGRAALGGLLPGDDDTVVGDGAGLQAGTRHEHQVPPGRAATKRQSCRRGRPQ
eukprot:4985073-Lingulodinium_polyedra.AAC.1